MIAIAEIDSGKPPKEKQIYDYILSIPYISENFTRVAQSNIKKLGINARVVVKSGQELKTKIKPPKINTCKCQLCQNNVTCTSRNIVYQATCKHCNENYVGASGRPCGIRLREHGGSIRRKDDRSTLAKHMKEKHPRNQPRNNERGSETLDYKYLLKNYNMSIISRNKDQLATFLSEAIKINKIKPQVNEMKTNGFIR